MRLLFVVPYAPSPIRVRPYQLIRTLARRGHQVTLVTVWTTESERDSLEQLAGDGVRVVADRLGVRRTLWNLVRTVPSRVPLQAAFCWQPTVARSLRSVLRDPDLDIVHVEHLRGAQYGLHAIQTLAVAGRDGGARRGRRPAVVWDSVDCISHLFTQAARESRSRKGRLMARLELERTRRYEGWLVTQFDRVLITSEADRRALLALSGAARPITVLHNGVDLEYFRPVDEPRAPATLVITGKMSYHANVTAVLHLVRDIMPLIWEQRPDVHLTIVGKDPAREIRALAARAPWSPVADDPASTLRGWPPGARRCVEVVGSVPDLRPYLRRATLAVAPVPYGAGVQNKVLEAMACGTPVVSSTQAASALAARPGRDLVLAATPDAFARAVLALLDTPNRRAEIGRAGRVYVEAHHDWTAVVAQLERLYQDAIDGVSPDMTDGATAAVSGGPVTDGSRTA